MLIRTLINMVLAFNDDIPENEQLFPHQKQIQQFLLGIYALCVPWMFLPKPYLVWRKHKAQQAKKHPTGYQNLDGSSTTTAAVDDDDEEDEFSMAEVIVNQMIETIEYTLSCISNTASYLRLWALSLAHGQLAEVFFNYGVIKAGQLAGGLGAALGVPVWIGATFAILLAMEGLSAFLHSLRLHWVELQNKFYIATGVEFLPLSFTQIINEDIDRQIEFESDQREKLQKLDD